MPIPPRPVVAQQQGGEVLIVRSGTISRKRILFHGSHRVNRWPTT